LRAKVEAVIGMIAVVFAPIVAVLTLDAVFAERCLRTRDSVGGCGGDCDPALLPYRAAANFAADRRRRVLRRSPRRFPRLPGRQRRHWRLRRPGLQSAPRRSPLAFSVPSG
ncbi:MAG: hypothetical protein WCF75_08545, partial [Pseudolabrys sp.]